MKHPVLVAVASMIVGLGLAQRSPAAEGMDKAAFAEFLGQMQAIAQTAKLTDPNDRLFWTLRDRSYKEEALDPLKAAMSTLPVTEAGIFTAGRLLIPLASSDAEVVRKALPAVSTAQGRLIKYLPMPVHSKEELRSMGLPPAPDPKANPEATLKVVAEFSDRRQKRLEAEGKVIRTNLQSMLLEKAIWEVMLRAGRTGEDDSVLAAMSKAEQDKRVTYKFALDAIIEQASQIDQARAARLYKSLEKSGRGMELAEANYLNPGAVLLGTEENSFFRTPHCYPGVDMLRAANALASSAKLPALPVLSYEEVSADNMLAQLNALLRAGKPLSNEEVKGLLYRITAYYPKTKAAEEARKIQSSGGAPRKP